jgi:DNA-binding NtrC family response regulator
MLEYANREWRKGGLARTWLPVVNSLRAIRCSQATLRNRKRNKQMRLLIVGTLNGQLTTATKLAMDKGATVTHASDIAQAMAVLRSGRGADLLMVDVAIAIRDLVTGLEAEHIHAPIVACGTATDARAAVAAIQAGAKEYIPLPPDPELIAAVLAGSPTTPAN